MTIERFLDGLVLAVYSLINCKRRARYLLQLVLLRDCILVSMFVYALIFELLLEII